MYTRLEKYLLSAPVPALHLPALIEPTELDLLEREAQLGWHRDEGVGALIFQLRICGTVVVLPSELFQLFGGGNYETRT